MDEEIKYILSRIIDNAKDAIEESESDPSDDFFKGKRLAYYEVLDTIKGELTARDYDLAQMGLDINLERMFYPGDLGEWDPAYQFPNNPSEKDIKKAEEITRKYQKE